MEASTSSTPVPPNDITASDQLIPTVAPFNPIPNMFVPMKYRNIISPQPIYNDKGDFIILESLEWFTYMYELEKQLAWDRLKCMEQEILEQYHKERNAKDLQNKADASFHGSNVKRFGCWLNRKNSLSARHWLLP